MLKILVCGAVCGVAGLAALSLPDYGLKNIGKAVPISVAANIHGGCDWYQSQNCSAPQQGGNTCPSGKQGNGGLAWESGGSDQYGQPNGNNQIYCGGGVENTDCNPFYSGGLSYDGCSS